MPSPGIALFFGILTTGVQASETSATLSKVEALGKALFEQDRAASLATDRLLESNGRLPDGLRGWVVLPQNDGLRVVFVQEEQDLLCSTLDVMVNSDGAGPLRRSDTCEPLTAAQRGTFLARQAAIAALRARCSDAYNTVVLPHEGTDNVWAVYLLAATKEVGKVVIGGHVRVLVRDGGAEVVEYRPLSKTCLTLDQPSPTTGQAVALVVTHVLDDHPIETHVFLSLLHQLKLYVMTESAMWSVDKGRITLLMDGEDFDAYREKARAAADKKQSGGND